MVLSDPDFDKQLTVEQADVIARIVSSGQMHVYQFQSDVMLCVTGDRTGARMMAYQMTRRGITRAVADYYPTIGPLTPADVINHD